MTGKRPAALCCLPPKYYISVCVQANGRSSMSTMRKIAAFSDFSRDLGFKRPPEMDMSSQLVFIPRLQSRGRPVGVAILEGLGKSLADNCVLRSG